MSRRGPVLVGQVVGRRGVHSVRQVAVLLRMVVEPRLRRALARRWRAGVAVIHRARRVVLSPLRPLFTWHQRH